MSIRNQNWYNLQSTRRYPLDENSAGFDDAGELIRDDILVDCHIRFPETYGRYVYVQGITISSGLVSIVFGVADSPTATTGGAPLAALTVPQPAMVNVNYPITPIQPGVSGWVALGPGIEQTAAWRYSGAVQSVLAPRCARPYRPLPIPTLGKLGLATALEGVVRLSGALPVKVHYVENAGDVIKFVDNNPQVAETGVPAIVVELDQAQRTEAYDPLSLFLGPCGQRPESGTCAKPPIENINGIVPDCNGNIEISFEGFNATAFENCGGVDTITDIDLATACNETADDGGGGGDDGDDCFSVALTVATEADLATIPPEDRTPNMLVRTADTGELWRLDANLVDWRLVENLAQLVWPDTTQPPPDIVIDEAALPPIPCLDVPVCLGFDGCSTYGGTFEDLVKTEEILLDTVSGMFAAEPGFAGQPCICDDMAITADYEHNVYVAKNLNDINVALLRNCDSPYYLFNKTVTTDVAIGTGGLLQRAGLALYYNDSADVSGRQLFIVAAVLDRLQNSLRVLRYSNGVVAQETSAPLTINENSWYRIEATAIPNGNNVTLRIAAQELAAPENIVATTLTLTTDGSLVTYVIGNPGILADRTQASFNRFTVTSMWLP